MASCSVRSKEIRKINTSILYYHYKPGFPLKLGKDWPLSDYNNHVVNT